MSIEGFKVGLIDFRLRSKLVESLLQARVELMAEDALEKEPEEESGKGWLGLSQIAVYEGRCTGHCCESFYLPLTHVEVAELQAAIGRGDAIRYRDDLREMMPAVQPLGDVWTSPSGVRIHIRGGQHYTCAHFDKSTRLCRIYDQRPDMCRLYPYGRECQYADCTARIRYERYVNVGPPPPEDDDRAYELIPEDDAEVVSPSLPVPAYLDDSAEVCQKRAWRWRRGAKSNAPQEGVPHAATTIPLGE